MGIVDVARLRLGPDRTVRDDHIDFALDQIHGQLGYPSVIAAGGSPLDYHITSLNVSRVQ